MTRDRELLKAELLKETQKAVKGFLDDDEISEKIFCGLAFDCNLTYGEINFSFNTINEYLDDLGAWDFMCFYDAGVEETTEQEDIENILELLCNVLIDFSATETYRAIPKTEDFKLVCLDHDEDIEKAKERFEKVKAMRNK